MGIIGKPETQFCRANLACVDNVSLNADYPEFFFDIEQVTLKTVTLKGHNGDSLDGEYTIKGISDKPGEYVEVRMTSSFERMMHQPSTVFKVRPFNGKRIA